MTETEATELAKRIINTWRGGPNLQDWTEELTTLNQGQAGTTYHRLRRTLEHAPSVARFLAEYRTLDTTDASTRPDCSHCDRTGWTPTDDLILDWMHNRPRRYTQVQPCTCPAGDQAQRSNTWTRRT